MSLHILKQNTATSIIIGPMHDSVDGVSPENAIDVSTIDCDLYKGVTKSDLTLTAVAGDNDCVNTANGYYSLELTAGNTDTLWQGRITFNVAGVAPFWEDILVLPQNVYDALCGADKLQVDVVEGADIASILADTNELQADLVDGGRVDLLIDAIKAQTDLLAFTGSYVNAQVKARDNLDFGALEKAALNAAEPVLNSTAINTVTAGILAAVLEGSITVKAGFLKLMALCNTITVTSGTAAFKSADGAKTRFSIIDDGADGRTATDGDLT